jgi:hypothetical protein
VARPEGSRNAQPTFVIDGMDQLVVALSGAA